MSQDYQPITPEDKQRHKEEWRMFIFIIVFLFPILSIVIVGGYGFFIWMYQLLAGPPGGAG